MKINLFQLDDGRWFINAIQESGIMEVIELGVLEKEQAQRETIRRYPKDEIKCYDKVVAKAFREGRVKGVLPL